MHDAVRAMEGAKAVGKKQYSIRMVSPEISDSLSGYPHNAVTPLGMAHPVPVLLSHKLKSLPDAQLWLGGGEVDLKMRVDVTELMTKLVYEQAGRPPIFADITED
jgi:prolyl-tRNA editing enzyme YbaK/EbsC (Cys-tRNA(Pro) deacylase)